MVMQALPMGREGGGDSCFSRIMEIRQEKKIHKIILKDAVLSLIIKTSLFKTIFLKLE
jgi:hypothetical protein